MTTFAAFTCAWLLAAATPAHQFYVSIIDIYHNPATQSLEITCKLFTDDLEQAIAKASGQNIHLGEAGEHPNTDQFVRDYFQQKLRLTLNGSTAMVRYVGKEVEINSTWCYLEVADVRTLSHLEVTATLLFEVFDTQKNIVHIRTPQKKESLLLAKGAATDAVAF